MPLNEVSKLCQQCKKCCKQFSQVLVVKCPNFCNIQQKDAKFQKGIPLPHEKTTKQPISALKIEKRSPVGVNANLGEFGVSASSEGVFHV